ncbi:MAG: monofunctional biosynthetic peptidoglycan transglycosylase [Gammaproteobacteria bacterium]|nr:MAG: monofunctional biosynthetic peptidoglycan transglycosylase [Gammaproteobacteria bacterium]
MNIHVYAENRRKKKKSRKRKKSSSIIVRAITRSFKWSRNLVLVLVGLSLIATLALRWLNPPYTSFMIAQRVSTDFVPYKLNWVPLKEISPYLLIAAVAAEDQKFPNHYGFDLKAIQSAFEENKNQKRLRGASTITQQVSKNIFLWPKKSFFRKGLEAYFALLIETLWPKWRILEVYLNVAEFGPNIFGVKNAAYTHFNKSAAQLSQHEASVLAAVLPNPHKLHASHPSNYVLQRAEHISNQARSLGGAGYLKTIWE